MTGGCKRQGGDWARGGRIKPECKTENEKCNTKNEEKRTELIYKKAIKNFIDNLVAFRKLYPVRFITAHGSPHSDWDNRKLWDRYDFKEFGIQEDFTLMKQEMLNITDAGRRWNDLKVNRRDTSEGAYFPIIKPIWEIPKIIDEYERDLVMINIYPEHWAKNNLE